MAGGSLPRRDGHSSGTRIAARLEQPPRTTGLRNQPLPACAESVVPIRFCSRWGLPCRPRCRVRGALLPHLFTLTACRSTRRFDLCGAFPGVAPAGRYPAPCFRGARTFLPCRSRSGRPADWRASSALQRPEPSSAYAIPSRDCAFRSLKITQVTDFQRWMNPASQSDLSDRELSCWPVPHR